jgi:hypothetical protein
MAYRKNVDSKQVIGWQTETSGGYTGLLFEGIDLIRTYWADPSGHPVFHLFC